MPGLLEPSLLELSRPREVADLQLSRNTLFPSQKHRPETSSCHRAQHL